MSGKNLWGEMPNLDSIQTPHEILQEQGRYLIEATNGVLDFKIERQQKNTLFSYEFYITAPAIAVDYRLLRLTHDIKLFPAILHSEQNGEEYTSKSQEEFEDDLSAILSAEETLVLIRSLVAQARLETEG